MEQRTLKGLVLVTGGGGFIARALYARAEAEQWDCQFVALGRSDGPLREVEERFALVDAVRRVDVADAAGVENVITERRYDLVIHAAAAKYVDLSEHNAWDTHRVNVEGSMNVALAATRHGVPRIVAISTDKACLPANTYGATKFLMERLYQEADRWSSASRVSVCRYGNVIGSTGSALPRMKSQAAKGEAVTVTNPDMTRFWMTHDEAVDTILAAVHSIGGSVTVYPARASTLLAAVHGAVGDMRLVNIGERPGEKVHETLLTANEARRAVHNPGFGPYWRILPPTVPVTASNAAMPELTSDRPWNPDRWSAAEISAALVEAEKV